MDLWKHHNTRRINSTDPWTWTSDATTKGQKISGVGALSTKAFSMVGAILLIISNVIVT